MQGQGPTRYRHKPRGRCQDMFFQLGLGEEMIKLQWLQTFFEPGRCTELHLIELVRSGRNPRGADWAVAFRCCPHHRLHSDAFFCDGYEEEVLDLRISEDAMTAHLPRTARGETRRTRTQRPQRPPAQAAGRGVGMVW
ncbi:hypothetical protein AK812_SmicGene38214 [Symbiodinium microadriaticum]|uniref:Uncharacterized protein n=1 Tax=Symbiodinium microadriaticum TaxID=2951 RepID=A0A1Q9CEC0_SYMMI|nr:hypothetical protein AK812_SmicGene38214 [Symbiodinium microadriaticum]CAE7363042.1 unnamed protein product [Symbiodinium sp. KB8]CAE7492240.1 unnamed protein product [Symbiodinium microadriaticum]